MLNRLFTAAAILLAGTALADAPFCVVSAAGESCWYYSKSECKRAARDADGACRRNKGGTAAAGEFCVVDAAGTRCGYFSHGSCEASANATDGECVVKD